MGVTDRSYSAPKKIESEDLIALNTEFFYTERYGNHENVSLRIKPERREDIFLHKRKFWSGMVQ